MLLLFLWRVLGGVSQVALMQAEARKCILSATTKIFLQGVFSCDVCGCKQSRAEWEWITAKPCLLTDGSPEVFEPTLNLYFFFYVAFVNFSLLTWCVRRKKVSWKGNILPCDALGSVNAIRQEKRDTHIYYRKLSTSAKRYIDVTNMKQQRWYKTRSSKSP